MTTAILVLNAGSSSVKFAVFPEDRGEEPLLSGAVGRIGGNASVSILPAGGERKSEGVDAPTHAAALAVLATKLASHLPDATITGIGHRVVHGGALYSEPVVVDDGVLASLDTLTPLAPLHLPQGLEGIRTARALFPNARQIGCFDTAFHAEKPWLHNSFALPQSYYDAGLRRYGFHGLSCQSILRGLRDEGYPVADRKFVIAHLGNGCSATAVLGGKGHATTMGFSALDGLIMGTRCGQIDPGVLLYWMGQGKSAEEIETLLYRQSGLLGLSGLSNDMRDLEQSDDPAAARAIEAFVARAVEEICRLAGTMGGLDAVVFCGGIGENAASIRDRIMAGLTFLSSPEMLVRPTREELEIALSVRNLLSRAT
ncbi:MAG: acetate/propionate family kinase [Rhodobacteraceae bacterium]|nr:acetate/propionate family kinase [Paracoccaceae bacterium]